MIIDKPPKGFKLIEAVPGGMRFYADNGLGLDILLEKDSIKVGFYNGKSDCLGVYDSVEFKRDEPPHDKEVLELLMDCVNQGCQENDGNLCTMAISTYEYALAYLVKIGKAEWIKGKEGFLARWKNIAKEEK